METWKNIKNFEKYEVSNLGNVRRICKQFTKPLKLISNSKTHYMQCTLWKNNKSYTFNVHRLVAIAFIPNPENKSEVDHIDGNRHNNITSNLRWCTRNENMNFDLARKHISEGLKGRTLSQNVIERLRVINSGKGNPMYGKTHSDITKQIISTKLSNPSEETRSKIGKCHKVKIEQYNKQGELVKVWDCINDAAKFFGVSRGNISHCINGVRPSYKGYTFKKVQ